MASEFDPYRILELDRSATREQVQKAYRKLAARWHPDRNPDNRQEAEAKFKLIGQANAILSDPEKRDYFDRFGVRGLDAFGPSVPKPTSTPGGGSSEPASTSKAPRQQFNKADFEAEIARQPPSGSSSSGSRSGGGGGRSGGGGGGGRSGGKYDHYYEGDGLGGLGGLGGDFSQGSDWQQFHPHHQRPPLHPHHQHQHQHHQPRSRGQGYREFSLGGIEELVSAFKHTSPYGDPFADPQHVEDFEEDYYDYDGRKHRRGGGSRSRPSGSSDPHDPSRKPPAHQPIPQPIPSPPPEETATSQEGGDSWFGRLFGWGASEPASQAQQAPKTKKSGQKAPTIVELELEELFSGYSKQYQLANSGKFITLTVEKGTQHDEIVVVRDRKTKSEYPFHIKQKKHREFRRVGDNLYKLHPISLSKALIGFTCSFTSIDGKEVSYSTHSVTQPDQEHVFPGLGMPSRENPARRGNFVVVFQVRLPEHLDSEQRKIIAEVVACSESH